MPVFVLRGLWAVLIHSNLTLPLGPLGLLLGDPVLHRWHHARVARCTHNFANLAPYLDVLFGTHHRPLDEPTRSATPPRRGAASRGCSSSRSSRMLRTRDGERRPAALGRLV